MNARWWVKAVEIAKVTRLDILVFATAFGAGLVLYTLFHLIGAPQVLITTSLVLVMVAYAVTVARVPRLRVRFDQAGDNAYYLGLLFTLVSMAVALYAFGVAGRGTLTGDAERSAARRIIGDFGIALATTITGIFLRVFLHQMRVDPADVESSTRIELAEAAKAVKGRLDSLSIEVGRLIDELSQRTSDQIALLVNGGLNSLNDFATTVEKSTADLTGVVSNAHQQTTSHAADLIAQLKSAGSEASGVAARLRQVEPPTTEWSTRLTSLSQIFDNLAGDAKRAGEELTRAVAASEQVNKSLAQTATAFVQVGEASSARHDKAVHDIDQAAERLKKIVDAVGHSLQGTNQQLNDLENQSRKSAEAALDAQQAAKSVLESLTEMTRNLVEFINAKG